jgi:Tol biopolymer transport system component
MLESRQICVRPGSVSRHLSWPQSHGVASHAWLTSSTSERLNRVQPRLPERVLWRTVATGLLTLLAACDHAAPFQNSVDRPKGPFSTQIPIRLTYSIGDDRTPTWLPDGSGVMYSSERIDRPDHDRCFNVLPAGGGTVLKQYCPVAPIQDDSTNLMETPAISEDGRIFYHAVTSWIGQQKLGESMFMLGRADDPAGATRVTLIPYTAPNGKIHSSIRTPIWTGPETLIYLAEELFYEGSTFYPDTFFTGRDIVQIDLAGGAPVYTVIPGTDDASSVAISPDQPGVIYYTRGGDTRVYRRDLGSGIVSVVHDFGSAGIARDVAIHGNKLVAVVGRSVVWQFETAHNWVQRDEGGDLYFVDLGTGSSQVYSDSVLFRHPLFSPAGDRFVVEVQPFAPPHLAPDSDFNATNHRADLWLFTLP